jgi:predicted Zn-dependent protease
VRTSPDSALVRANLASVLLQDKRDPRGALEHARRAAALTPQNPAIHYTLGYAYRQTGDLRSAAESLSTVVRLAPRTAGGAAALKELAAIHEALGDSSRAAEARQTLVGWRSKR